MRGLARQKANALWMACLCCLHLWAVPTALGAPPLYEPTKWNRSCNLTVSNVPAAVFFNRSLDTDSEVLFPISPGYRIPVPEGDREYLSTVSVQRSCFGPGQRVNQTLVGSGLKMPCGYAIRPSGVVDYWEETVCERSLRSNCYCYALNAKTNSGYCIPGYNSVGDISVDFRSQAEGGPCADAMRKVQLDGGWPVTRKEVYAQVQPAKGHFIALVVWPDRDFHFFRRDAQGWWSQKRGDTFVTNTLPNGSVVLDVERTEIMGSYSKFCGYFLVDADIHNSTDSAWTYSSVPKRLEEARQRGYAVASTPLPQPSTGWMRLNYPYLLFGLDAAVFESGDRQLPWQTGMVVSESGPRGSRQGAPALLPHWVSHVQHTTTVQERDVAIRALYKGAMRRP